MDDFLLQQEAMSKNADTDYTISDYCKLSPFCLIF